MDIASIEPGMVSATSVRHPARPDLELVKPDVPLDRRMTDILLRLGVPQLWIRWPGLDFLDKAVHTQALDVREDVFTSLKRDFEASQARTIGVGLYLRYCNLVSELTIALLSAGRNGVGAETAGIFDSGPGLFRHAASVTHLSLTLGIRLESYVVQERRHAGLTAASDLTNLGVGAMLHDVGKLQLPSAQSQHEPLSGPLSASYARHPRQGYRMLSDQIAATAKAVVLHHHQRFDGSGFPEISTVSRHRKGGTLKGRDIHIFPRIVALCDSFDHLCRDDEGRPRPTVAALHDLLAGDLQRRFDPIALRALLAHVPAFPIGAQVQLNDGRSAAVIGLNPSEPCDPVVRLLSEGDPLKRDLHLAKSPDKHIVRLLGADVAKWRFRLPPKDLPPAGWSQYAVGTSAGE